jgi:hypothetical protein
LLFENLPHRIEIDELFGGHLRHEDTAVRNDLDETHRRQPRQRLSNRNDADVEPARQLDLIDAAAGLQRSGDEHRADASHHLFGDGTVSSFGGVGIGEGRGDHVYNLYAAARRLKRNAAVNAVGALSRYTFHCTHIFTVELAMYQ